MAEGRVISGEVAQFLESGLSINVATRDAELQPDGAIAWAAQVHADRRHLTIFLHKDAAKAMLRNLRQHPEIAVAFELPTTHRACQVKGRFVSTRSAKTSERDLVTRQLDMFSSDLEKIGIPRSMTSGLEVWPCTAIQFQITEIFQQTPGPGTGEPLQ
jgi:hypothetical protein